MGDVGSERTLCGPAPGIGSGKRGTRHLLGSKCLIASEAASGSRSGTEVKKRVPYGGHSPPNAQCGRSLGKRLRGLRVAVEGLDDREEATKR
jgi:hypothetical protein